MSSARIPIWLDCDPGHDDAIAVILAGYHPRSNLLGVSTVAGNQELYKVSQNACNVLWLSGLTYTTVYKGQKAPLLRAPVYAQAVHGETGLDLQNGTGDKLFDSDEIFRSSKALLSSRKAVFAIHDAVLSVLNTEPLQKLCIVTTASLTNMAVFLTLYPELIPQIRVVCMGGCIREGNMNPVAEFNFMVDPEATKIVFESGVDLTMIPLEVTHTACVTEKVLARLCGESDTSQFQLFIRQLLEFFAETYKEVYGFDHPPVHDPCAVFCALHPELFKLEHMRVDIETSSSLSAGQSVCDVWHKSTKPRNCYVGRQMDVPKFWDAVAVAVSTAESRSPVTKQSPLSDNSES